MPPSLIKYDSRGLEEPFKTMGRLKNVLSDARFTLIIGFMSDGDGAFRPKFEVLMNGKSWTPLFNSVPAQYRRLKDDGEPITYFDLG